MNEPVRILQWGMGPNLGGVDCLMMDIYRHIDRFKVQFDFLCDHDADKLAFEDEILAMGGRVFRVMVSPTRIRDKVPYHIDVVFPRPS